MKWLIGWVLIVGVAGCIPIGFQGRTSAIDAPGRSVAAPSSAPQVPATTGAVSA